MLRRIEERLVEEGIEAFYLDGMTPPKEPLAMADALNAGERGVFLISLRRRRDRAEPHRSGYGDFV